MSIEVQLDNESKTYLAGDEIFGKVVTTFEAKKTIRGISVEFVGNTNVSWCNYYHTKFSSSQTHFNHLITLHGEQIREKNTHMEAGSYDYPFRYILPASLPSSFEGQHGSTKYIIRATINIPWEKNEQFICVEEIIVNAIVALDNLGKAHRPLSIEIVDKTYGKIIATASASISGFTKGEEVSFKISVKNHTKLLINEVRLELQQIETYNANKPYWCTKIEKLTIQETDFGPVEANTFKNMETKIVFPDLIPSGLGYCPILDLEYKLRLVCVLSNSSELSESCVIYIGTIPLFNFKGQSSSSQGSNVYY